MKKQPKFRGVAGDATLQKNNRKKFRCEKCYGLKLLIVVLVFAAELLLGMLFNAIGLGEIHIFTIYVMGIIITAQLTASRICSFIAVVGIFIFNFCFAEPICSFRATNLGFPVTFFILLLAAFILGTITATSKKRAKEIVETRLRLQDEKLRSDLLRSISHDLRTPLTGIAGNAALLARQGECMTPQLRQEFGEEIWMDSIHMIDMVENLLAATKMGEVRCNIVMQPELVDEIILEAINKKKRLYPHHKIVTDLGSDICIARCNAQLISQVINNLLDNAAKFSPKDTIIMVRLYAKGTSVCIEIQDEGEGLSEEMKKKIFTLFYIQEGKSGDQKEGFGIGLVVCKEIIEAHGGVFSEQNVIPHGAVFKFTLPRENK